MQIIEQEVELKVVEPLEYDSERVNLIDADSLIYMACHGNDDISAIENAKGVLMDSMDNIVSACNSGLNMVFLTGNPSKKGVNFRKLIDENYKANRTIKPTIFNELKEWFIEWCQSKDYVVECGIFVEADDLIIARSERANKCVISCIDKDIIGNANVTCFNYRKNEFIEPNALISSVFELMQCVIGDSTDNIKGINGYGAKKTQSLFKPYLERYLQGDFEKSKALLREILFNEVILPLFYSQYGELKGYQKAIETMQLVSLRQLKNGAINLWCPSIFKLERLKEQMQ